MVCGGGGATRRGGRARGRCSLRRRCVRVGAGGCCAGGSCGGDGGGGAVEVNTRRRRSSLDLCCGPSLSLQSGRAGAASGFCGAGAVHRDSCLVGVEVAASAGKKDSSLPVVFVGRALSLPVVGVVSRDMFDGASSHVIVDVIVAGAVVLEAAQSTMEVACSHTRALRMAVDIVAALVVATGMGWVVGFLGALGQLACLDSILVLPYLAVFLR